MSNEPIEEFRQQRKSEIQNQGSDGELKSLTRDWFDKSCQHNYCYHFDWLSRPIIQYPQDIVVMQELIWSTKPDLIIECGVAHGGSLIFSASMLAMIDYCSAAEQGISLDPKASTSRVLGIDIDIRSHNRREIERHPLHHKIQLIQGSSVSPEVVAEVKKIASSHKTILVVLDSNHTHAHVLAELEAYAGLASVNSYCVVFDTAIEDMPAEMHGNRPWGPGDNPKTAVWEFLKTHPEFEIDKATENKLLITVAPDGFLKRIS
jgi:cephalosporin hydroxylase